MSESSVKMMKPVYFIASTADAYMAPLAHSSYEFLRFGPTRQVNFCHALG
jgi:hypothetical protein